MMFDVSILLVEDEDDNADLFMETCELDFTAQELKPKWTVKNRAALARRTIRDDPAFDIVIVDLYLGRDEVMDGLDVVKEARSKSTLSYILALTSHPEWNIGFRDQVRPYANAVVERAELWRNPRWTFAELAKIIHTHLMQMGKISVGETKFQKDDAEMVALMEAMADAVEAGGTVEVGKRALRALSMSCLASEIEQDAGLTFSSMGGGRSGAQVCALQVQSRTGLQRFVLKLGVNRRSAEREFGLARTLSRLADSDSFMPLVGTVATHECGYSALAFRLADDAITLSEWLLESQSDAERLNDVADILFQEQLGKLVGRVSASRGKIADWLPLKGARRLHVRNVIANLSVVMGDARGGARIDGELIEATLLEYLEAGGAFITSDAAVLEMEFPLIPVLGDLHARNVLIRLGIVPRPVLIDAACSGMGHWSTDAARLLVDLIIRVQNPATASLWNDVTANIRVAEELCPYCMPKSEMAGAGRIDIFVDRCLSRLAQFTHAGDLGVLSEDWHWQWHVAVMKELLRFATYEDIAAPRAVVALVAGAGHLQRARALIADRAYG